MEISSFLRLVKTPDRLVEPEISTKRSPAFSRGPPRFAPMTIYKIIKIFGKKDGNLY